MDPSLSVFLDLGAALMPDDPVCEVIRAASVAELDALPEPLTAALVAYVQASTRLIKTWEALSSEAVA